MIQSPHIQTLICTKLICTIPLLYNTLFVQNLSIQHLVCTKLELTKPCLYKTWIYKTSFLQNLKKLFHFPVFKACYLTRDACYYCQSFGSYKTSSVTLGQLTYSQLTTHSLTKFAAPNRLVYLALLAVLQNPNLTFNNYDTISISVASILLIVGRG